MASGPVVSIILAVFNGDAYLQEAIDSLVGQSFRDFELIVVDDGSTDRSPEILRAYTDPRLRILRNSENQGLTPSLNRGLAEARGEFIARQDADDISEPDRLARQVDFLRRRPEIVMTGSWYREIDSSGAILGNVRLPVDTLSLRWGLLLYCPFAHSAAVWRRVPVAREVGPYDPRFQYAMDHDLWNRIAARFPVANVGDYLVRYRLGPHSLTSNHPKAASEELEARLPHVARLSGWDAGSKEENRQRFERLFALVKGPELPDSLEEIREGILDLRRLHRGFAAELGLSASERKRHVREVEGALARRLMRRALVVRSRGRRADARELFRQGVALDPRTLLTTVAARYLVGVPLRRPG